MAARWRILVVALLLAGPAAAVRNAVGQSAGRTVAGVVQDSSTGEALPRAYVSAVGAANTALTNTDGRFALFGVPAGPLTLEVRYIGYAPATIRIGDAPADTGTVVIRLVRPVIRLGTVDVESQRILGVDAGSRVGEIAVSAEQVATTPSLGEVDIFRTLQLLPGVSNANRATSGLYVRGGTPDQNLVLLDGMTMYHVDHFFGLFSAFNADAVKDIRLFPGGYPAKYGGRVSSVVELTGKTGDETTFRGSAGLGLLSARAAAEVPLGRGSLVVTARRSYTDIVQSRLYDKLFAVTGGSTTTIQQPGPGGGGPGGGGPGGGGAFFNAQTLAPVFYFYDANAKLSYRPSEHDLVSLSLYAGDDRLDQSQTSQVTFRGGPGGAFGGGTGIGDGSAGSIANTDVSDWGNRGVSGRWLRQWSPRWSSDALVAMSSYHSDADRSSSAVLAATAGNAGTLARPSVREHNTVEDLTVRVDNEITASTRLRFTAGAGITRSHVQYNFTQGQGDSTTGGVRRGAEGLLAAVYAQSEWAPTRSLLLTTGLRVSADDATERTYAEPRVSASYQVNRVVRIHGAWGKYNQFVNRVENEDVLSGSRDFWLLADTGLAPTGAEHRVGGITFDLNDYLLSVEAYDKKLDNVSLFSRRFRRVGVAADFNTLFYQGTGEARGLEFLVQKKYGRLTGWAAYTLAEATERYDEVDDGAAFPSAQDQRHEAKVSAAYQLGQWTLSSAFTFGSGTPYTSPESQYYLTLLDGSRVGYIHVGDKNGERLPSFHRLDAALFRRFTGNARFDWEVGLSVFNLYDRANVAYRQFDLTTTPITVTDVRSLGRTPSIDVRVFLK